MSKKRKNKSVLMPKASNKKDLKNVGAILTSNEQCIAAMDFILSADKFGYEFTGKNLDNLKTIRLHLHNMSKLLSKMQKGIEKHGEKKQDHLRIM